MKELSDNGLKALQYLFFTLIVIVFIIGAVWVTSPTEWTFNINLTADDNVLEIVKTAEEMQEESNNISDSWEISYNNSLQLFTLREEYKTFCSSHGMFELRVFTIEEAERYQQDSAFKILNLSEENCVIEVKDE